MLSLRSTSMSAAPRHTISALKRTASRPCISFQSFAILASRSVPHRHLRRDAQATSTRFYSSTPEHSDAITPPEYLSEMELLVFKKLKAEFQPAKLEVKDISGGCGSMFALDVVSARFNGLSVIKQHQLVNKVLAEEIKSWHGVQLKTKPA